MDTSRTVKSPTPRGRTRAFQSLLLLGLSAPLPACETAAPKGEAVVERDSAGIAIAEVGSRFPEWRVAPDTVLRIGVVEGDPSHQFDRIAYAARLSDGRIAVVDGGALEVRWFDASGLHIESYARRGAGPGELRAIGEGPLVVRDTIVLYDPRNQRVLALAPDGEPGWEQAFEGGRQTRLVGVRGGSIIAVAADHQFDYSREYSRVPGTVTLLETQPSGSDTIAQLRGTDTALWVRIVDGIPLATVMVELPFAAPLLFASAGDEIVAVRGDEPQLLFIGLDGDPVRIVRLIDEVPQAVTAEDRSRYVTHAVQQAERRGVPTGPSAESARARLALLDEGHRMPVLDRLLVGSDDLIWVRKYRPPWAGEESQVWLIFQPDGRAAGQLLLPPGFELMHTGSHFVTGVIRDELDVQYVVVFRTEQ